MTRKEQITAALDLCAPPPRKRKACREYVEEALDLLDSAGRAVEHARVTKKAISDHAKALRRFEIATDAAIAAGVPLATRPPDSLLKIKLSDLPDDARVLKNHPVMRGLAAWPRMWEPPSRSLKHRYAVLLAYELLIRWKPDNIVVSRNGRWHQLAAVLFGDPKVNLYRHLFAFQKAWKGKIRRRQK
jgi:hypothetical protein